MEHATITFIKIKTKWITKNLRINVQIMFLEVLKNDFFKGLNIINLIIKEYSFEQPTSNNT